MAMQARISTIEGDAGKIDDAVKIINEKILPALKGLEGFTAANFLADRSSRKAGGGRLLPRRGRPRGKRRSSQADANRSGRGDERQGRWLRVLRAGGAELVKGGIPSLATWWAISVGKRRVSFRGHP